MGIPGIYGEIGPGERIALSKLAVEKFEKSNRPLRIAVDISIWQFQIQSGKGGSNPALRTLYYRLLRLLSLSIQPLFVFDGPHKPTFKRNRRTGPSSASIPNFLTKQLLKIFGFPFIIAPGEAEAECALLQREGVVDAVLSEDVDILMFGCTLSMRNWSSEGATGNHAPTHVSVYDSSKIVNGKSKLDRESMILVALMSGGDYNPAGVPGCGIKVACEAARAGFGTSLFKISRGNIEGFKAWRDKLSHELLSNESKYFRVRHKALKIPETFPDPEVLGYYTHPIVSSAAQVEKFKADLQWDGELDLAALRVFVADAFEWRHKSGAIKLVRGLAPALLIWKLRVRSRAPALADGSPTRMGEQERLLIKSFCGKRAHFSTDGLQEIRVSYIPADIVGLDLNDEEPDTEHTEGFEAEVSPAFEEGEAGAPSIATTAAAAKHRAPYDPTQPEKIWVVSTYIRAGVPLSYKDWDRSLRDKASKPKKTTTKYKTKVSCAGPVMKQVALDSFVKTGKPGAVSQVKQKPHSTSKSPSPASVVLPSKLVDKPPRSGVQQSKDSRKQASDSRSHSKSKPAKLVTKGLNTAIGARHRQTTVTNSDDLQGENPWTLAKRPPATARRSLETGRCASASDIIISSPTLRNPCPSEAVQTPQSHKRHTRSPSPNSRPAMPQSPGASPAPNGKEVGSPSPRKKRTLNSLPRVVGQGTAQPYAVDLRTPKQDVDAIVPYHLERGDTKAPFSGTKVNRRLEFSSPVRPHAGEEQEFPFSPSLTSSSTFMAAVKRPVRSSPITLSSSPPLQRRGSKAVTTKFTPKQGIPMRLTRMIALRESLAGAWKEVDELEAISRADVFSNVEVLDMTAHD